MKYNTPFILPSFPDPEDIARDIKEIVEGNWYTNFGPYESRFRNNITSYLGGNVEVCTVSNATQALDIAVKALFKGHAKKNKVIIPSFTFAAGGNVILMNNFYPLFIDVDERWQPDIAQTSQYLQDHDDEVAGILLCNIFGVGNDEVAKWEELAKKYQLPLIIDSAAGFGSQYPWGEVLGSRGDCEIFSLHATKPFSVGEGGLITAKNAQLIKECRSLTNFGFSERRKVELLGTNAKLNEISCAIGIRQLEGLNQRLQNRRESFAQYRAQLEAAGYTFQYNSDKSTVAFVSVLAPTAQQAQEALTRLKEASVEAKQYYDPLTRQPLFAAYVDNLHSLTMTNDIADRIICLPLHDNMDSHDIKSITALLSGITTN